LATDSGSRTSVMLSRIILAEKYGLAGKSAPSLISRRADLATMLGEADAALLIGDAALRIDPEKLPFETLDLGGEWVSMTGLPMVFAVWAGRKELLLPNFTAAFNNSCRYGLAHLDEIVRSESITRGFPEPVVREYLASRIVFELGARDYAGLELFLEKASRLDNSVSAFAAQGLSL
jgi:chorismate dehydratase